MALLAADPASVIATPGPSGSVAQADASAPSPISLRTQTPPAIAILPPVPVPTDAQAAPPGDGEIVVTGRRRDPGDPFEKVNIESFKVTMAVDTAIMRPVAKTYQKILPAPLRDGIRNLLLNLREPVVFLNFLLQHKIGKAASTLGRFTVNSTIGVAGLIDVARRKPFRLPLRPNGFGDTLGFYGVKGGTFLYLPVIGPTTVRDLIGSTVDRFVLPFAVGGPFRNPAVTLPLGAFSTIDHRAQFDETLEALRHDTPDAYVASREFYLARRQAEIDELHGKGFRVVKPTSDSVKPTISEPRTR